MTDTTRPLWTLQEICTAIGADVGASDGDLAVSGISIDSRTLEAGDVFIAILGPHFDGHDYVADAFAAGAVAAIISHEVDAPEGRLLHIGDTLAALEALGQAGRRRMRGKIVAVTGSVGKTSVKEGLREALSPSGKTHVSAASHNNLWGVPLSLARMAADTDYGVFEIGMNHAGEITPLVAQVKPDIAVITKIAPAHIEHFDSEADIARAKAEIFSGLDGMKLALLPADSPHLDLLRAAARKAGAANIFTFGESAKADTRSISVKIHAHCSCLSGNIMGQDVTLRIGLPGHHMVLNALAILSVVQLLGADLAFAALALGEMEGLAGRGRRHEINLADGILTIIDESYNANPESMRAGLTLLGQIPRRGKGRRIAVLGDMKELGDNSKARHAALAQYVATADIDVVFTLGIDMVALYENLPPGRIGAHTNNLEQLKNTLLRDLHGEDVVMLKGSNAMGLAKIVDALLAMEQVSESQLKSDGRHG